MSCSTSSAASRFPPASGSKSSSSGCCPLPRRSAPPRISRCPSGMPPSARSSASRTGRRSRRSTPSRCAPRRRSVAESELPTEEELREALDRVGVAEVLLQAITATASLGFRRVSPEARDLAAGPPRNRGAPGARAGPQRGRRRRRRSPRPRASAREPSARICERCSRGQPGHVQIGHCKVVCEVQH